MLAVKKCKLLAALSLYLDKNRSFRLLLQWHVVFMLENQKRKKVFVWKAHNFLRFRRKKSWIMKKPRRSAVIAKGFQILFHSSVRRMVAHTSSRRRIELQFYEYLKLFFLKPLVCYPWYYHSLKYVFNGRLTFCILVIPFRISIHRYSFFRFYTLS